MGKPKNKNYQRIDKKIIDAFKELLKDKDESEISVSLISKKANINRTTFYLHYKGIWEITDKCEDIFIEDMFSFIEPINFDTDINKAYEFFEIINKYYIDNKEYILKLFSLSHLSRILGKINAGIKQQILKYYPEIEKNTPIQLEELNTIFSIYTGGVINSYVAALKGDIKNLEVLGKVQADYYISTINYVLKSRL